MTIRNQKSNRGYSLIELMVSMAVMAIVGSQLLLAFSSQYETYIEQDQLSRTQQDVRILTDAILGDLRMAGFMVPKEFGVGTIDGTTTDPDVLCISDPTVFVPTEYEDAPARYDAVDISSNLGGNDSTVTLVASQMDIDEDGNDDFVDGAGILISDGSTTHCGLITDLTGAVVTFAPLTASGATFSAFSTRAVPAMIYQVDSATATLTRNGLVLSNHMEDLQVEFGVDEDGNGQIEGAEFPIHDLAGSNLSRIRMARVSMTSRTAMADIKFSGSRAASANRLAGAADNFKRRKAVADSVLRNMK
jgi:prepilin-type N-terminal cleavage/methylation domain-containing protein